MPAGPACLAPPAITLVIIPPKCLASCLASPTLTTATAAAATPIALIARASLTPPALAAAAVPAIAAMVFSMPTTPVPALLVARPPARLLCRRRAAVPANVLPTHVPIAAPLAAPLAAPVPLCMRWVAVPPRGGRWGFRGRIPRTSAAVSSARGPGVVRVQQQAVASAAVAASWRSRKHVVKMCF